MRHWILLAVLMLAPTLAIAPTFAQPAATAEETYLPKQCILLLLGAEGEAKYGQEFRQWADQWRQSAKSAGAEFTVIGDGSDEATDRELISEALLKQTDAQCDRFWLVLIGHGTYDGAAAKFNLRGADVTASELSEWLAPLKSPTVVVNCASASGPFINELSAEGRIVITATKSGFEMNFAHFGKYFAAAVNDPSADLDKDDQVSLLEAYLTACSRVEEFYKEDARLASEHALLDDNGDGLGTPASWFRGLRATQQAKAGAELDGARAHQIHLAPSDREARMPPELRKRRDALELELAALREQKSAISESAYFDQLEPLMLKLARIYQTVETSAPTEGKPSGQDATPAATSE